MANKQVLCRASNGLFVRNLGWRVTAGGKYAQHKFYLGREEARARLANLRLEQLWVEVGQRWQRENKTALAPTDRPIWDSVTLAVAEAVRNGEPLARVPLPIPFSALVPESSMIGEWLDELQADITVIKIELRDDTAQKHTIEWTERQGQRLIDMGKRLLRRRVGSQTLHAAFDAYAVWVRSRCVSAEKRPTAWSGTQARQIEFLRKHLSDVPLVELESRRIEDLIEVLRLRPPSKLGAPVSVSWTQSCIKRLRHFLKWLNKAHEFEWKRPADLDLASVRIPRTPQEQRMSASSAQVQTYSIDELRILWEYATPFQRLLMLLALNCGFGRAEVAALDLSEVVLRQQHPHESEVGCSSSGEDSWVFRVRQKTGVYAEFKLWPETAAAVEWWLQQREAISAAPEITTLLLTRNGSRFDTLTKGNHPNNQIPNGWLRLTMQIREDHPDFRQLSFSKLRKTAANLIRAETGGEIAAVFLCHGTPVKTDELLDAYTNRPFARVFEAIERVGAKLRILWRSVEVPFPAVQRRRGASISLGMIRRIQSMKRQGFRESHIANALEISAQTVRKWAKYQLEAEPNKPFDTLGDSSVPSAKDEGKRHNRHNS